MSKRIVELLQSAEQLQFEKELEDLPALAVLLRKPGGPMVISADDIVALSPAMRDALPEDGQEIYMALKPKADVAREAVFQFLLSQPHAEGSTVVFTAGGPGSGKSTFAHGLLEAEFVYDSIFGNPQTAGEMIRRCLSLGRQVRVLLVVRDPADAMSGNLARALTEKRVASAVGMTEAHVASRASVKKLAEVFRHTANVRFFAVESGSGKLFTVMGLDEVAELPFDETLQKVVGVLNGYAQGTARSWTGEKLPDYIIRAARGGQRESGSDRA